MHDVGVDAVAQRHAGWCRRRRVEGTPGRPPVSVESDRCMAGGLPTASFVRQQKPPSHGWLGGSQWALDDDLLSHGETPHYHRRCVVSLLSSGWDQVVPTLYGRQAIRWGRRLAAPSRIGHVMSVSRWLCGSAGFSVQSASTSPAVPVLAVGQIVWVLYGQASRAISMG